MTTYKEITEARKLLGLPERATMQEIKASYRALLARWHPDHCDGDTRQSTEMTRKIVDAYQTILTYCDHYEYSFSKNEAKKNMTPREWWMAHFGEDSVWGKSSGSK